MRRPQQFWLKQASRRRSTARRRPPRCARPRLREGSSAPRHHCHRHRCHQQHWHHHRRASCQPKQFSLGVQGHVTEGGTADPRSSHCSRRHSARPTLVKINFKTVDTTRTLQCQHDAPSMSGPGQWWSDRERFGSSMMTDIGGAAHTSTSRSSLLSPISPHKQFSYVRHI